MISARKLLAIMVIFIPGVRNACQDFNETEYPDFETIIEELFPLQEEDFDYTDVYDRLFSIYRAPIDLNTCTRESLEDLYFLNPIQVQSLLDYRQKFGRFLSVYELLAIPNFERATVDQLIHFVTVGVDADHTRFGRRFQPPEDHRLLLRYDRVIEKSRGYSEMDSTARFLGSAARIFGRYTFSKKGDYHLGFTFEKDPGEQVRWNPGQHQYGMDYMVWHAMIENRGFVKSAIIGDYSLDFGQGLVYGSGLRMGKGLETISTIKRSGTGIRPYRSVFEQRDFRGAAVQIGSDHLSVTGFWSYLKRDALPRLDSAIVEEPYITYIKSTGLHRNMTELAAKHRFSEHSFGMNAEANLWSDRVRVGVNAIETRYDYALIPTPRVYNQYAFSGKLNRNASIYGSLMWKYLHVFGELAVSQSKGTGAVAGLISSVTSFLHVSFLWRKYDRHFHTFYGKPFGENNQKSNETGYYIGLKVLPSRNVHINIFYDRFRFPWLRYYADAPSEGSEIAGVITYQPNRSLKLRAIFRHKVKEKNHLEEGASTSRLKNEVKDSFRADLDWTSSSGLRLTTRMQLMRYAFVDREEPGFLIAQDLQHTWKRFQLTVRASYFNTDGYASRIYVYERDIPLVYHIPAYYGHGIRYYFMAGMKWSRHFSGWFKISQTNYFDRSTIGSGLDEIEGQRRTRFKLQVLFRM